MSTPTLFVNSFQKGSAENSNIGLGTLVGIDTYTKKGVAQLTKDTTAVTTVGFTWPSIPKYIANDGGLNYSVLLTNLTGESQLYYSVDGGFTWHDSGAQIDVNAGSGLYYFNGFFHAFATTKVYHYTDVTNPAGSGAGSAWQTGLNSGEHPSVLNPSDNNVYFGNGNTVGMFGPVPGVTYNPAGTINVNYLFYPNRSGSIGGNTSFNLLPSNYQINCISFILPTYIALGTGSSSASSQIADLVLWNFSQPTAEPPLRLYSRAAQNGVISGSAQNGIIQMVNRNNMLYCVTAGNFAIYETNITNFSLISDISLHSNIRKVGGNESTLPVYIAGYSQAIAVIGNKILTGISTPNSPNYPTNYGLFPCGVWTVAFSDGGGIGEIAFGINGNSVQCEYTISTGTIVATNNVFQIGFIFPTVAQSALISWADGTSYGIDYINFNPANYQNNIDNVIIESEMMEIGTPLSPVTVGNLQFNLVRNLMTGQTISLYYRTGFDQDFTAVTSFDFNGTFTGDGTMNAYSINTNPIGATRYIQFQIHMATVPSSTNATIATFTPQLRNFIIGNAITK